MGYTRRRFIKTLAVSASALVTTSLVGCGSSDKEDTTEVAVEPSMLNGSHFFPQSVVSGDPRPDSVILWTRIDDLSGNDTAVILQVSSDESFSSLVVEQSFTALADTDHCLKIRVNELNAGQHYYYRFVYQKGDDNYVSRIGRTKTAPALDSDVKVKFATVSCQDYIGRYYNNYLSVLAHDDLDFVVHLGDYIYETTGDALFQSTGGERSIEFTDSDGALTIGVGDAAYQSANTVDNYRQLYKTYRKDSLLQQVHERFPMIAIWDDHEFSDDSWGDTATSLDGAADEKQTQRKINSEIAYFEHMPIDHHQPHAMNEALPSGALAIDENHLFPNTRIYRDFHFGQHLHLAMTDFRTNRPDHIIAEDAFPGKVELDQATLNGFLLATGMPQAQVDVVISQMSPCVDIDAAPFAPYKAAFLEVFTGLYMTELMSRIEMDQATAFGQAQQRAVSAVSGKLATSYLNQVLTGAKASLPADNAIQLLPALPESGVEQGLAFYTMGKTSLFNYLGSRYFIIKETFDLYAGYKEFVAQQQGSSVQGGFDTAQTNWLAQTFATSSSTWKLLGSSVSFTPLLLDLSPSRPDSGNIPLESTLSSDAVPAAFKQRFYIEADQWDGFPQYKANFIENVLSQYGVHTLGGDVHSSYVTEHKANSSNGNKSFNFTTSSVSSATFGSFMEDGLNTLLSQLGDVPDSVSSLPLFFSSLVQTATKRDDIADDLVFARMYDHGVMITEVDGNRMNVDFHNIQAQVNGVDTIKQSFYQNADAYLAMVTEHKFTLVDGQLTKLS